MKNQTLNLRGIDFQNDPNIQNSIEVILDGFLVSFLNKKNLNLSIIVGKGVNSKNLIKGKNILRFYTENYLNILGLSWRNGNYFEGQEGVIIVEF
jgi:hypothetical protein